MTAPAEPTAPLPAAATIDATVSALDRAAVHAKAHLAALDEAPVRPTAPLETLRARFVRPLPEEGLDPAAVIDELAANAEGGLVRSAGPRYFGFVIGGSVPAALAADWLTSAWDQNAGLYVIGPAAAVAEETAGAWLIDLFGLPETASVGYTTGATMASFTGLAAGRHALLAKAGWDVERQGLFGAPEIPVVVSDESHVTIFAALQMLGMGRDRVIRVPTDDQGRMRPEALAAVLRDLDRPALVTAQAGNVNTGAFDPLPPIVEAVRANGGWLHVDGAFGLWAAADPSRRHLVDGVGDADSWTTDAHKWLNVPVRLGAVVRARRGRPPRRDDARGGVLRRDRGRRARPVQLGPGVLAPGARVPDLGGAAQPRPAGRRGADRPQLRRRAAVRGRARGRRRHPDPQRRRPQPGPGALRGPVRGPGARAMPGPWRSSRRSSRMARSGSAGRPGTGCARCGSRCPTG